MFVVGRVMVYFVSGKHRYCTKSFPLLRSRFILCEIHPTQIYLWALVQFIPVSSFIRPYSLFSSSQPLPSSPSATFYISQSPTSCFSSPLDTPPPPSRKSAFAFSHFPFPHPYFSRNVFIIRRLSATRSLSLCR